VFAVRLRVSVAYLGASTARRTRSEGSLEGRVGAEHPIDFGDSLDAGHTVSLHPAAFTTDVAEFRAALQTAGRSDRPAERAARLAGAAEAFRGGGRLRPDDRSEGYDRSIAEARAALGEERFAAAWAAGRQMGQEQAVREALGRAGPPENV
jgi:hypothetical protein